MPEPLNVSIQLQLAEGRRPPNNPSLGPPPAGTWLSSYADKRGHRWVEGDDRLQILPYGGRIFRVKKAYQEGGQVSHLVHWNGFYDPSPLGDAPYSGDNWVGNSPPFFVGADKTYNKAYEKFKEVALGANASWGATIAEGRDALGMVATRSGQLFRSYRALRKGNFTRFCKELGIEPKRKHKRYTTWHEGSRKSVVREVARKSSGLWLEYWFGWAPLAGEIFQSTVILSQQAAGGQHWGASGMKLAEQESFFVNAFEGVGKRLIESGTYVVKTGAYITYSNPNTALVQQMGLANPLAIAWELVPFSFVVDWFTNVGDCIGALSDLYGVDLSRPYTTEFLRTNYHADVVWGYYYTPFYTTWWKYDYQTWQHRRKHGLISPVFVRPRIANFGQSLTRAATAVSLLVSIFSKK